MKPAAFTALLASVFAGGVLASAPCTSISSSQCRPLTCGTPFAAAFTCTDKQVLSSTYIGANKDVKLEVLSCANALHESRSAVQRGRPTCAELHVSTTRATNCFAPAGGGPNPYDCQVIADAAVGQTIFMQYATCETFFVDQASYNLTYCRSAWSDVVEYVAFNCQSQQNAHGGNCVANDQSWFIQSVELVCVPVGTYVLMPNPLCRVQTA
ncbi:hypothetical protein BU15DRAFT_46676 [Melanogaster broomeanus]|nr:hypothetical protein BU15DRAFT_46676 [Melanogaster broomeanus]